MSKYLSIAHFKTVLCAPITSCADVLKPNFNYIKIRD